MITNLYPIDSKWLCKKEWYRRKYKDNLERGKQKYEQTGGEQRQEQGVGRDRVEGESAGRDSWNDGHSGGGMETYDSGNFLKPIF